MGYLRLVQRYYDMTGSVTRCWSKKYPKCSQKLPKKEPQQF